jgi:TonB family protein
MRRFHVFLAISLLLHIGLFAAVALPGFSPKGKTVSVVTEVDLVSGPPSGAVSGGGLKNLAMPSPVPKIRDFGEISKDVPVNERLSKLPEPDLDSEPASPSTSPQQGHQSRQGNADSSGGNAYGEVARNVIWKGIVIRKFQEVWQIPEGVPISPNLQAMYRIGLSRSGNIISIKLMGSSGNRPYDRSVEIALDKIKQVPPPPGGKDDWIFIFVPPYGN